MKKSRRHPTRLDYADEVDALFVFKDGLRGKQAGQRPSSASGPVGDYSDTVDRVLLRQDKDKDRSSAKPRLNRSQAPTRRLSTLRQKIAECVILATKLNGRALAEVSQLLQKARKLVSMQQTG